MLEAIRKYSTGIVVKILFGLLIISFAVWGVPNVFRDSGPSTAVASVGEMEIPPDRLRRELDWQARNFKEKFGAQLDTGQMRAMGLVDATLNSLIENALFDIGAGELGVTVSDRLVRDVIRNTPNFANILGEFDRSALLQFLQSLGMSEQNFIEQMRDDLVRLQFLGSIRAGSGAPRGMVEAIYRYRQERRTAEILSIADKAMTGIAAPSPEVLAEFHKENANLFTAPEYRKLTVVRLRAEQLAKEIAVSEEDILEAFEQNADQFVQRERRHLQQILTGDEDTAKRIHEMLSEGRDFVEVGKEMAGEGAEFVDLGVVSRDEMLDEMADAAYSLSEGAFSQPIKSMLGWHVIRVVGIEESRQKTLEEVRGELTAEIAAERSIDSLFALANRLEDELGGGATLEEASERLNLELIRIDSVDRNGLDTGGNRVEGLPLAGSFLDIAFETPEGTESNLTEAGSTGYFIVRVDGITPPALRPLETVKDDVTAAWAARQRSKASAELAKTILERLRGGAEPSTVAKETGVDLKISKPFTRSGEGADNGLPQALVASIFSIKPGEAVMTRGTDVSFVARLKEIQDAAPYTDEDGLKAIGKQVAQSLQADLQAQLANVLRERYTVSVNQKALDEYF